MPIKTYSIKQHGRGYKLSANFILGEFACSDGSDKVLIDDALVSYLQKIRDHFQAAVIIHSAFRTAAHNKKEGGSPNSQHLYGTAADIVVKGVAPMEVAQYAEALGIGGIGLYGTFTHIDTRAVKTRWDQRSGKEKAVSGFGGQAPAATKTVSITVEAKPFTVFGATKQLRAGLVDNENYVHLRDFCAATGLTVEYDAATKQIRIIK